MLPLSDGLPTRRFPLVNVTLIVANFAVWLFYEIPHLDAAVTHSSFYPCSVAADCHSPLPWGVSWFTAMFLHGSWDHILGNMLFLAVFGKNVEDAFGRLGYLAFYLVGGFVATATQTAMTLLVGSAADARVPTLGASGAIAAVLGAYVVLHPRSQVRGLLGIFPARFSAWFFLGTGPARRDRGRACAGRAGQRRAMTSSRFVVAVNYREYWNLQVFLKALGGASF
jgi:membrane associated rhomboid family serine protease